MMNAPELYVGQEARFGGKVVEVLNQQGKTRLEIATVPLDSGARPVLGEASRGRIYADVSGSSIRSIFAVSWSPSLGRLPVPCRPCR